MKKTFDRKIIAGFVLALTIWLAIGSILYRNTSEQAQEARWLSHTYDALAKIQELLLRITEGETARRGFVMSGGRGQFLTQYSNAVDRANTAFGQLRALTADNPVQQRTCDALQPLIQKRFAVDSESINCQLRPETDASVQLRLTEKGQEIMAHIRRLIAEMDLAERGYLQQRRDASEANLRRTQKIALAGFFVGSIMLGWAFVVFARENRGRHHAEEALRKVNEALEIRVHARTAELADALEAHRQAEQEIKKLNEELEKRVVERTVQLENATKELEAFSYSVSHDLRAPLRHIDGFAEMLRDDASAVLGERSRRYLETISTSAKRMGTLIDDLLVFSRMGRVEMRQTRFPMDRLVNEVLKEMAGQFKGREIEWDIDPLPEVWADRAMLKQVWVNLLSNAVKFTRPRDHAKIQIGCTRTSQRELQFCVRDNGVGFEMQYAGKLYGVFQRLHPAEEFGGTGIGLANVRRIVHRHGGRTWAEAKVNEGATFYFAVPDGTFA
jgi:signal transduction histidine kinase